MSKVLEFKFGGYDGWDFWLGVLPHTWQTKKIAQAFIKSQTTPAGVRPDVKTTPLLITTPWGCFRIIDLKGNTERCVRDHYIRY